MADGTKKNKNDIWISNPGEWVMYGFNSDPEPLGFYFKPSAVKALGDNVVYTARFPLKSASPTAQQGASFLATYDDDRTALDCKKSAFVLIERTIYGKSGEGPYLTLNGVIRSP